VKLYGHPASTCTQKVLFTLAEKGVQPDFIVVDITKGEQKSPAHLARQPFGVVPALDDDGYALYESRAIIRYLAATVPGTSLIPADPKAAGKMEQWISVEHGYFSPQAMKAVLNIWYASMGGGQPDAEVVAAGKAGAARALDVIEAALVGQDWLAGEFSLADICYAPYLNYLQMMGLGDIIAERPNVAAWWGRLSSRPAWLKATGKQA
jgi:glutathione S-transferase